MCPLTLKFLLICIPSELEALTLTFLSEFYSEIKTKNVMKPAYKASYQLWKIDVTIYLQPKLYKVQNLRIVNPPIFKCRPS